MAPKKPTKKKGQSKAGTSKKTGSGSGNGGEQNGLAAKLEKNVDIIVSMSAIHHLDSDSKKRVYHGCYDMLNPNGWFFNIDEMRTDNDDAYLDELNFWYDFSGDMSIYYEKWKTHFERWKERNIDGFGTEKVAGDDMHDRYAAQLDWLKDAGFDRVNLFYKYHLWNLIGGKKTIK